MSFVYFIQAGYNGPIKIGVARDPAKRLCGLQVANAERLSLLGVLPGGFALEKALHAKLSADRIYGEWFEPTDAVLDIVDSIPDERMEEFEQLLTKLDDKAFLTIHMLSEEAQGGRVSFYKAGPLAKMIKSTVRDFMAELGRLESLGLLEMRKEGRKTVLTVNPLMCGLG